MAPLFQKYFRYYPFVLHTSKKITQINETSNLKHKLINPTVLVIRSCLLVASVAQCLKAMGRNSALFMLTTSQKKQVSRLTVLAHYFSSNDKTKTSLLPCSASAILALASILSLETGASVESSISEIGVPLIPRTAILLGCLKLSSDNENKVGTHPATGALSYWHGLKDGFVDLLESKLRWGGPSAVQELCTSGIPMLLINLLAKNPLKASPQGNECTRDDVGLSPVGLVWTVSSICHCLPGGSTTFRQIMKTEHIKIISDLLSDVHLKLVKCWVGPGGGKDGVRDIINTVIDLLAFPVVVVQNAPGLPAATASINSGFLLNLGSPGGRISMENKDMVKVIEEDLGKYTKILLEVQVSIPFVFTFWL